MRTVDIDPADQNIRTVARLEETARLNRSFAERISDRVTELAGSGLSVCLHAVIFGAWVAANTAGEQFRFDPFPFSLLTSMVSLEVIFLTLFVLANQSRLKREAARREHLNLQINLLSEQEMTVVLQMLKELSQHFNLTETTNSPAFRALIKRTDLGDLAERLDRNLQSANATKDPAR